jgi:hypothetical protein
MNPNDLIPFDTTVIPWPTFVSEWALCLTSGPVGRVWIEHKLIHGVLVSKLVNPLDMQNFHDVLISIGGKVADVLSHIPPLENSQVRAIKFTGIPDCMDMRVGKFGTDIFIFLPKPEFEQG